MPATAVAPVEIRQYNKRIAVGAKKNEDGSFSVGVPAGKLEQFAFVDFYNERRGTGYQRNEPLRDRRAKDIAEYILRCRESGVAPRLGELTANARLQGEDEIGVADFTFTPLDEAESIGTLVLRYKGEDWLSVIDGGTRCAGIAKAIELGYLDPEHPIDVRLYIGHSVAEEVALFLLVNEKQKKVRTDLSARVVQRQLDEGNLSDEELAVLQTVVPETETWRYEAVRIVARLNSDRGSVWRKLVQMPGEQVTQPLKLQAFWTSLNGLLNDEELSGVLDDMEQQGNLTLNGRRVTRTQFITQVLKNYWGAVAEVNPRAFEEPFTTVLFGAVGVTASHIALVPTLLRILSRPEPDLSQEHFVAMLKDSTVADYDFWFTRPGDEGEYPDEKGEATHHIGASGYVRLARQLEREWRKALKTTAGGPVKV